MDKEKLIQELNKVIDINNDRIEGYETATKETKDGELINLFFQFIQTSKKCNTELISEVLQLGGIPKKRTEIIGKFFMVWMEVKAALTSNFRSAILTSCEYGERNAIQTYTKILRKNNADLNKNHLQLLNRQLTLINNDLNYLKDLRNKLLALA